MNRAINTVNNRRIHVQENITISHRDDPISTATTSS